MNEGKFNVIIREFENVIKFLRYKCEIYKWALRFRRKNRRAPRSLKEIFKMKGFPKRLKNNPLTGRPFTPKRGEKFFERMMK